ncbi:helix-turn-helix domain-containing protein [Pseudoalteromonas denitrificans]|uniref:Helix-turn-helix domain-containing protein n=1 Tax=Pseudoalteromonas denitrificans DSM 6059 TaxID=1123010 RepID=A0A1I1T792_9GAMM|nr:helix-turn-helix domain-containing protein [Pseudoalteromonas denitrificans]SFD53008.1 Helix-turn-helix domain-containing protein [Pseudoalteromonas denitrificans DSM 6059]
MTKSILTRQIVKYIKTNKNCIFINQITHEFSITKRTLQRLFETHIGQPPKWVIERYRMMDALDKLNTSNKVSLTELSHQLGYFDLAHFSKAFTTLMGTPPSHYHFSE